MNKKEIEKNYIIKINQIRKYDKAYFEKDSPLVSDEYYDNIRQEILHLEKKHKYLKSKDSPSKKVGYIPSRKFKKISHEIPMLSLSNAFSALDIKDFIKKPV